MTFEEAIFELERCRDIVKESKYDWLDERDLPMINMAIEAMKAHQLTPYSAWFRIGETLVDESKGHITAEQAIVKIREYMQRMEKPERTTEKEGDGE